MTFDPWHGQMMASLRNDGEGAESEECGFNEKDDVS